MALTPEDLERPEPFDADVVARLEAQVDEALRFAYSQDQLAITARLPVSMRQSGDLSELRRRYTVRGWNVQVYADSTSTAFSVAPRVPQLPPGWRDKGEAMIGAAYWKEDGHEA